MKVIVSTCDKYCNAVEALKYTLEKHGGADWDVTVLGFKQPNFNLGDWKFVSLGEDIGPGNLSNDLWKFFETFDDEFFIWLNDDIVIVDDIDHELLNDMINKIKNNSQIGRICITSATKMHYMNYPIYENNGNFQYREVPQTAEYRLSLNTSLWRTSYFKKYCTQGAGNWVWETRKDAINDGVTILGTTGRYVLDFGHLFRYGNYTMSNLWWASEYTGKSLSEHDLSHVVSILKNNYPLNNIQII